MTDRSLRRAARPCLQRLTLVLPGLAILGLTLSGMGLAQTRFAIALALITAPWWILLALVSFG